LLQAPLEAIERMDILKNIKDIGYLTRTGNERNVDNEGLKGRGPNTNKYNTFGPAVSGGTQRWHERPQQQAPMD